MRKNDLFSVVIPAGLIAAHTGLLGAGCIRPLEWSATEENESSSRIRGLSVE